MIFNPEQRDVADIKSISPLSVTVQNSKPHANLVFKPKRKTLQLPIQNQRSFTGPCSRDRLADLNRLLRPEKDAFVQ